MARQQFTPRTPHAIMRDLLSKVVGRTKLNDVTVGSALYTFLQSIAYEVANMEGRIAAVRNSFDLNTAQGADLDTRVAELPPVGIKRKNRTIASGAVLTIKRTNSDGDFIIPIGSKVSRSDDKFQYTIPQQVTIPDGDIQIENVFIIADIGGVEGNCVSGKIDTVQDMPSGISSVEQTNAITNGTDRESDVSLRNRALRYIRSLGRCQVDALVSLALNFIDSNGSSFRFANVYEDPQYLGYSELIVDDGSGLRQFTKPGGRTTATVPPSGQDYVYMEYPVASEYDDIAFNIDKSANGAGVITLQEQDIIFLPERGLIYLKDASILEPGDVWSVDNYNVFSGPVQELQKEIEGSTDDDGNISTGFRAAGTRVRVLPPTVKDLFFTISIDVKPEYDINDVKFNIKGIIENYVANLGIGEPLYIADLIKTIMNQANIYSIKIYQHNTTTLLEDTYPGNQRTVLRTSAAFINYV